MRVLKGKMVVVVVENESDGQECRWSSSSLRFGWAAESEQSTVMK